MTTMASLLRWRKRCNVSVPSPPTFYYRRGTFSSSGECLHSNAVNKIMNRPSLSWFGVKKRGP